MWTKDQQAQAAPEGWRLVTTFNLGDNHPLWDIATVGPRFTTDRDASLAVIDAAKRGSAFHQRALQLVASSRMRHQPKGKK
jgi:hypothetical protein